MAGVIRVTLERLRSTSARLHLGAAVVGATLAEPGGQVNDSGGEWAGTGRATSYAGNDQRIGASVGNA